MRSVLLALIALAATAEAIAQDRTAQAIQNYRAVLAGTKQISQLTAQEQADIAEVDRRRRAAQPDDRPADQRCIETELRREGASVSALAQRIIEMKCRDTGS